jgi:hypothetical protein
VPAGARCSMLTGFFAASGISKWCFGLDFAPPCRAYPTPNQRLTNLYTLRRARMRACETSERSNPAGRNFDEPVPEGSIYAAPQSIGMFAIEGSTTTFVKDQGARGGAIIGADVFPIPIDQRKNMLCFSSMKTSNHDWLHKAASIRPSISK